MRSLIPETVRIMALTATATKHTRQAVVKCLKMVHPAIVSVSPNKPNSKYSVLLNVHSLEETFVPLVEEVRQKRKKMYRTIILCTDIHVYGKPVGEGDDVTYWCVP